MPRCEWKGLRFEIPEGWAEHASLTVGPQGAGGALRGAVTVTAEPAAEISLEERLQQLEQTVEQLKAQLTSMEDSQKKQDVKFVETG